MITVQEALEIIGSTSISYGTESIPLTEAKGRILAEEIYADRDFPPFDRVTMDGISIHYDAYAAGKRTFSIESIAAAGSPFQNLKDKENCIESMTGAGLPNGCDTVIRYEDLDINESAQTATIHPEAVVNKSQNIHFQGIDQAKSEILLPKGIIIRPSEIGIAASQGYATIQVVKTPKVAIISTGDELVPITEKPEPYQIRKSNVYSIQARLEDYGIQSTLYHILDDEASIRKTLQELLDTFDILILSGGVSKGKFDFIPDALADLGVKKLFHKIKQRPGKPFWFGQKENKIIFALPGNPVSSFVCTKKYIESWLQKSLGVHRPKPFGILGSDVHFKPALHYFLEVDIEYTPNGKIIAHPKKGNGSGDFVNLKRAQAFIELPIGKDQFKKGEVYPLLFFEA